MKTLLLMGLTLGVWAFGAETESSRDKCCQSNDNKFTPIQFSDDKLKCLREDEKGKKLGKLVDAKFCEPICCRKRRTYTSGLTFGECEELDGEKADAIYCELENADNGKVCCKLEDGRFAVVPKKECEVKNQEDNGVCYEELTFVCCQVQENEEKKGLGFGGFLVERMTDCKALLPPGTKAKDKDQCASDPNFDLIDRITR